MADESFARHESTKIFREKTSSLILLTTYFPLIETGFGAAMSVVTRKKNQVDKNIKNITHSASTKEISGRKKNY